MNYTKVKVKMATGRRDRIPVPPRKHCPALQTQLFPKLSVMIMIYIVFIIF